MDRIPSAAAINNITSPTPQTTSKQQQPSTLGLGILSYFKFALQASQTTLLTPEQARVPPSPHHDQDNSEHVTPPTSPPTSTCSQYLPKKQNTQPAQDPNVMEMQHSGPNIPHPVSIEIDTKSPLTIATLATPYSRMLVASEAKDKEIKEKTHGEKSLSNQKRREENKCLEGEVKEHKEQEGEEMVDGREILECKTKKAADTKVTKKIAEATATEAINKITVALETEGIKNIGETAAALLQKKIEDFSNYSTSENFDIFSDQIIEIVNQSVDESVKVASRIAFEKAIDEPKFAVMMAQLTQKMARKILSETKGDNSKGPTGKTISGVTLFLRYLVSRCQEDFKRDFEVRLPRAGEQHYVIAPKVKDKRRNLDLVKFLCELFKVQVISEGIMHKLIQMLLSNATDPEEKTIEPLYTLMTSIGGILDHEKAKKCIDGYFDRIGDYTRSNKLSPGSKFMLLELINLRAMKWTSKTSQKFHVDPTAKSSSKLSGVDQPSFNSGANIIIRPPWTAKTHISSPPAVPSGPNLNALKLPPSLPSNPPLDNRVLNLHHNHSSLLPLKSTPLQPAILHSLLLQVKQEMDNNVKDSINVNSLPYQWSWKEDKQGKHYNGQPWVAYSHNQNVEIEEAWQKWLQNYSLAAWLPSDATPAKDVLPSLRILGDSNRGVIYEIQFNPDGNHMQRNCKTGYRRPIRRNVNDATSVPPSQAPATPIVKLPSAAAVIKASPPTTPVVELPTSIDLKKSKAPTKLMTEIIPMDGNWVLIDKSEREAAVHKIAKQHGVVTELQPGSQAIKLTGQEESVCMVKVEIYKWGFEKAEQPENWTAFDLSQNCVLVPLDKNKDEWRTVSLRVAQTMPEARIAKIERVQNRYLRATFEHHCKQMSKKNSGNVNKMFLFHGTRTTHPSDIYKDEEGFDPRRSAQGLWGKGCYFAMNASYSHDFAFRDLFGIKTFFLAEVIIGDAVTLPPNSKLRMPPVKPTKSTQFANEKYDSVKGTTNGSEVYIVYSMGRFYPTYLITYSGI